MEQDRQYGNWLPAPQLPSTRTPLQQIAGTYVLAGPTAPPLPLQTRSSSCLAEDDDYDDGGFITAKVADFREISPPVTEGEDMGKQNVLSTAEFTQGKDRRRLHVFILYVLMAICFVMCAGLLSVFLIKYSAMSEELRALNLNYSEMLMRAWKDLDYSQAAQKIMERTVSNNFSELQDITPSICGEGSFLVSQLCPINWKMEGRNCYYFSTEEKNWTDALSHCINQKAYLVTILSDEEQGFLVYNLDALTYWLGMTDVEKEGKWRWTEGNLHISTIFFGLPFNSSRLLIAAGDHGAGFGVEESRRGDVRRTVVLYTALGHGLLLCVPIATIGFVKRS